MLLLLNVSIPPVFIINAPTFCPVTVTITVAPELIVTLSSASGIPSASTPVCVQVAILFQSPPVDGAMKVADLAEKNVNIRKQVKEIFFMRYFL
jgi:hypothetical protein